MLKTMRWLERFKRTRTYRPGMYNSLPKRLNWEQIEARPRREGFQNVVKGTSKRVVVVKSPDSRIFEQAIFIVREDFLKRRGGGTQPDIIREAQQVADRYIKTAVLPPGRGFSLSRLSLVLLIAAGLGLAAAIYLFVRFFIL